MSGIKNVYFKLGALACIVLGLLHTMSQLLKDKSGNQELARALDVMEQTSIQAMGTHSLLKFYNGFSLTMGILLIAFGAQAYATATPTRRLAAVNTLSSLVLFVVAVVYFHPLAYLFLLLALVCFAISYLKLARGGKA